CQHGPGGFSEHNEGDVVGLRQKHVSRGHAFGDHMLNATKQLLVFDLLVGESHQRLEYRLIAEQLLAGELQNLRGDIELDQTENIGVSSSLDLAQESTLVHSEKVETIDKGHPVW